MKHYQGTGVTEVEGIEINRPMGALIIGVSNLAALVDEQIRVYIEGGQRAGQDLVKKIKLLPVMVLAQHGDGSIFAENGGALHYCVIQIAKGGGIELRDKEFIKVDLTSLDNTATYAVHSLEAPGTHTGYIGYNFYPILDQLDEDRVDVRGADLAYITGQANITKFTKEFSREMKSQPRDYDSVGLRALENEANDFVATNADNTIDSHGAGVVVDVSNVDFLKIEKTAGQNVELFLMSA